MNMALNGLDDFSYKFQKIEFVNPHTWCIHIVTLNRLITRMRPISCLKDRVLHPSKFPTNDILHSIIVSGESDQLDHFTLPVLFLHSETLTDHSERSLIWWIIECGHREVSTLHRCAKRLALFWFLSEC